MLHLRSALDPRARVSAAAFVLPNAPIPPETPLETFAVPLAKLEAALSKHQIELFRHSV